MKHLNRGKDEVRATLNRDVQAWVAEGHTIPLVPIIVRDKGCTSPTGRAESIKRIKVATRSPTSRRAEGVRMLEQGMSHMQIAMALSVHRKTVNSWARDHKQRRAQ